MTALVRRFGLEDSVSGQVQDVIDRHPGPDVAGYPVDPEMRRREIRRLLGPQAFQAWEETGLGLAVSPDGGQQVADSTQTDGNVGLH